MARSRLGRRTSRPHGTGRAIFSLADVPCGGTMTSETAKEQSGDLAAGLPDETAAKLPAELARIRDNMLSMLERGASETDINAYLKSEQPEPATNSADPFAGLIDEIKLMQIAATPPICGPVDER